MENTETNDFREFCGWCERRGLELKSKRDDLQGAVFRDGSSGVFYSCRGGHGRRLRVTVTGHDGEKFWRLIDAAVQEDSPELVRKFLSMAVPGISVMTAMILLKRSCCSEIASLRKVSDDLGQVNDAMESAIGKLREASANC